MKKETKQAIKHIAIGFAGLLVIKYLIVGLDDWNNVLHPERIEAKTMPLFFHQGLILSEKDLAKLK